MKKIVVCMLTILSLIACDKDNSSPKVATDGLVLYFPFNGNAENESPNPPTNTDGYINGATLTEDRHGKPNRAYRFDGIDDYIEVGHHESYNFDSRRQFSLSFWIKPDYEQVEKNPRSDNEILSKWHMPDNTTNGGYPFVIAIINKGNKQGQIVARTYGGDSDCPSQSFQSGVALNDQQFHHVVMMRKASELVLFVDGEEVAGYEENYQDGCIIKNAAPLRIGQGDDLENFKGVIDDIRIYDKSLDEDEIKLLFEE